MNKLKKNSAFWLIIIFLISIVSKVMLLNSVWYKIWGDELYYNDMARSLYQSGTLKFANMYGPNQAYLYPMILSLVFPFYKVETITFLSRFLGIVLMSSVIVPVYLLAREMKYSKKVALLMSMLSIMLPDMLQTLFTATEVIAYPIFIWTLYFFYKSIGDKKVNVYTVLFAIFCYLSYSIRSLNLVFFPAYIIYSFFFVVMNIRKKEKECARTELVKVVLYTIVFVGLYILIPKLLLSLGVVEEATNETMGLGISQLIEGIKSKFLYSILNWTSGVLWNLFYILLSFGVFTIVLPSAFTYKEEKEQRLRIFLNILLLGFIAVIVLIITGREDPIDAEFRRIHLRYVFYFFMPYILLLYRIEVEKIKRNVISNFLYIFFIIFIIFNGVASGLKVSFGVEDFFISFIKELKLFIVEYPYAEGYLQIIALLFCVGIFMIIKNFGWKKFLFNIFPIMIICVCLLNNVIGINNLQDVTIRGNAGFLERNIPIATVLNQYQQGEVILLAESLVADNEIQSLQLLLEKTVDKLSLSEFDAEIEKGNGIVDFSAFERAPYLYASETGHILENAKCVGVRRMWIDGKYIIENELIYQDNYFLIYELEDGKMMVSKVTGDDLENEQINTNIDLEQNFRPIINSQTEPMKVLSTEKTDYVKAVHYFSDAWPLNFWNSEIENLEKELIQIKEDGFNTIVLVLPWKEFQTSIEPIQYNQYPFELLERIMQEAEKQGIFVMVRIGYTWDFYSDKTGNILQERYYNILHDEKTKEAWIEYAAAIYTAVSKYDNFLGGFLCWEDFWNNVYIAKTVDNSNNVELAVEFGYQKYIKEHYTLEEVMELYEETFESFDDIYIPSAEHKAFILFFEFYDMFLNNLLYDTQTVFPNLSMEVRVDADLVNTNDGYQYYSHNATYKCDGSDFTTIVYGIPMGFENKGERVSAEQAIEMTNSILGNVNDVIGDKSLFVDQFLFVDNTPAFSHNAQVKEEELESYLDMLATVLINQTWGYGVWTYQDYCSNMLYNSEFALGANGWNIVGDSTIQIVDGSNMLLLDDGAMISQDIPVLRNHFGTEVIYVQFDVEYLDENIGNELEVIMGETVQKITLTEEGTYTCSFTNPDYSKFSIKTESAVLLDNVKVYSHIQEGRLYTLDGQDEDCIQEIRDLNNQIDNLLIQKEMNKPFYSLTDDFSNVEITGFVESQDYLQGKNCGIYYDRLSGEKAIYITPGVSLEYEIVLDDISRVLQFSYEYYEIAKEWGSDGARIDIFINGQVLDSVLVDPKNELLDYSLALADYLGEKITLKLECHQEGDAIGDWILLYQPICK